MLKAKIYKYTLSYYLATPAIFLTERCEINEKFGLNSFFPLFKEPFATYICWIWNVLTIKKLIEQQPGQVISKWS